MEPATHVQKGPGAMERLRASFVHRTVCSAPTLLVNAQGVSPEMGFPSQENRAICVAINLGVTERCNVKAAFGPAKAAIQRMENAQHASQDSDLNQLQPHAPSAHMESGAMAQSRAK